VKGLAHVARWIEHAPVQDMPARARELAALALVDFVAAALAGSREPVAEPVLRQCEEAAAGGATVIGHARRVRPLDAAFANGTLGHALDFDDSNMVLGGHPSVVLWPSLMALGETRHATGSELLEAYLVGFEVLMAFSRTVNFDHYEKGWHPTATLGTFAAAAACARLLRLPDAQCAHAIGLASSMASGVKANFGSMAKPLQVGEASRRGLMCALLARDGATASPGALEARQGFFNVYNGAGHWRDEGLMALGDGFEILRSGIQFKKYACCGSTHAPVDAALSLKERSGLAMADIESVQVALNPRRRPHVDRPVVDDELAAKFSVQFTVAAALADGALRLQHFSPESIARRDLQDLLGRVSVGDLAGADSQLSQACEVTVLTRGGQSHALRLEDAKGRGADEYPGYMRQKFTDCAHPLLDAAQATRLLDALLALDGCADVAPLVGRLGGPTPGKTPCSISP
jgi:2-methylcitrate dehydratase PrpD